jgi:two-component system chemotaxis sensor kinase CheA
MDELLEQFVIEGRELTQSASDDLFALENAPADAARLGSVFRSFHTLKGSAGLFGFAPMEAALHVAEDVAGAVRAGRLVLSAGVIGAMHACVGLIEAWIDAVAVSGGLPPEAAAQGEAITRALRAALPGAEAATVAAEQGDVPGWLAPLLARQADAVASAGPGLLAVRYVPTVDCFFRGDDPLDLLRSVEGLVAVEVRPREACEAAPIDPFACHLVIEAIAACPLEALRQVFRLVPDQIEIVGVPDAPASTEADDPGTDTPGKTTSGLARDRTLRIDLARLDRLADLSAELIVAKNRLWHLIRAAESAAAESYPAAWRGLRAGQAELDRLVGDLNRAVTSSRLVPLGQLFQRLPRLVRETATRLGRVVVLEVEGAAIEAEKRVADGLFEPLLHVVRNAIGHGIEPPAARIALGKSEAGRLVVRAAREGARIAIEVSDDGAGIDTAAVRRIAAERGVMSEPALAALDEVGAMELLFAPGFSTAQEVSDISGRGVGLDAVRSAIAALGGDVSVTSRRGHGTTMRFSLPQNVVITTVLQVFAGGQGFGVRVDDVAETLRLPASRIAGIGAGSAFSRHGETVPLLRLETLLGLEAPVRNGGDCRILVVRSGDGTVGVEVSGFGERLEAVLRPMSGLLAGMQGLLGTALLGDGSVMLVLDLPLLVG